MTSIVLKIQAATILRRYRTLERTPSGERYRAKYVRLENYVQGHQDALLELVFSGAAQGMADGHNLELNHLIFFGGHKGSLGREYNEHWVEFMARVRARQSELPEFERQSLDWLLSTHGW